MKELNQVLAAAAPKIGMIHFGDALFDPSEVIGLSAGIARDGIDLKIMLRGGAVIEQAMPPMEELQKLMTALEGRQNSGHSARFRS